jgi:uncharacterized protein YabN with tetrapyrrole methylase and pyrophosphatase domain
VFEKLKEEAGELQGELGSGAAKARKMERGGPQQRAGAEDAEKNKRVEEEMGDLLFAAVNLARWLEIDPEIALKKANAKFAARFRGMEKMAADSGRALADVQREEMERLWEAAKHDEKKGSQAGARQSL